MVLVILSLASATFLTQYYNAMPYQRDTMNMKCPLYLLTLSNTVSLVKCCL